jgi:hypothetical protein
MLPSQLTKQITLEFIIWMEAETMYSPDGYILTKPSPKYINKTFTIDNLYDYWFQFIL